MNVRRRFRVGAATVIAALAALASGTSPGITALPAGGYEAAFQANTTSLWVAGSAGTGALNLGMSTHTSPAITP